MNFGVAMIETHSCEKGLHIYYIYGSCPTCTRFLVQSGNSCAGSLQWMVVLLLMSDRSENGSLLLSQMILPLLPMDYLTTYNKFLLLLMDWLA